MLEPVFSPEQIAELRKPLDDKTVKHRQGGGGSDLKYLAGYQVIDTANRLFGEGNWGYDLLGVELNNVTDSKGEIIGLYFSARVKVTVTGCVPITEEGVCAVQEARNPRAQVDAHDMARKGAITDAMKRGLRCFGNQFGNPLYDKDYGHTPATESKSQQAATTPTAARVTQSAPAPVNRPSPAPSAPQQARPASTPAPAPPVTPASTSTPIPALAPALSYEPASDLQKSAITKMALTHGWDATVLKKKLYDRYGYPLDVLPKKDAGDFITLLQDKARV